MKKIRRLVSILVVLSLLVVPFGFFRAAAEEEFNPKDYEAYLQGVDPNRPSVLIDYFCVMPSDSFGTDKIDFAGRNLYLEDLPFGKDTIVLCLAAASGAASYFLFIDGSTKTLLEFYPSPSGRIAFKYNGQNHLYGFGFNPQHGGFISFMGQTGLSRLSTSDPDSDGWYHLSLAGGVYSFWDIDIQLTSNVRMPFLCTANNGDYNVFSNGPFGVAVRYDIFNYITSDGPVGFASYPSKADSGNDAQKGIWQTLKDGFNSILEWIRSIPQKVTEFLKNLGQFFTDLGNKISGFISSAVENIRGFFSSLGDRISDFFDSLGDRLGGFFTNLKNYLLWFNAEGSAAYTNPFDKLTEPLEKFFNEQIAKVNNFKTSMNNSLTEVKTYIGGMFGFLDDFVKLSPILTAFLVFGVCLIVVRKVVGR